MAITTTFILALSDVYIGAKVNQTCTSAYQCDKESATVEAFVGGEGRELVVLKSLSLIS